MCDYCGCRSEPEIAALSADHERMLALTAQLRRAHERGHPAPELVAEESDLFPAAHQMLGSDAWATIAASDDSADG